MASLENISNTKSGTLRNEKTSLVEKSKWRLGNEMTMEEAVFPVKKRKKNSIKNNQSDPPETESTKGRRKRCKSNEKMERELKVKMKEMIRQQQKEKLKEEKMELEAVILRLQLTKLLLEMEKLSEERERIAVEKSNISLRYDILSLHSQLSGHSSPLTWRPCSSSSDNSKEDSMLVTPNKANVGTLSSNSKNVGVASDPSAITSSLSSLLQKGLTHLSANDKSLLTNLGLTSNSSISGAHKKAPVFYLCSTDPNMKGNIGIAAPLHAGQVKKGVVLSKKIETNKVAMESRQQPAAIAIQHNLPPRIQHPQNVGAQASTVTSKSSNVSVKAGEPKLARTYPCVKNRLKERFILPATNMLENTVVSGTSVMRPFGTRVFSAISQPCKQITNTDSIQHGSIVVSDKSVGNKYKSNEGAIIIPDNLYVDERTEVKHELQSDS